MWVVFDVCECKFCLRITIIWIAITFYDNSEEGQFAKILNISSLLQTDIENNAIGVTKH